MIQVTPTSKLKQLGFQVPRFHGLSVIWAASIVLSTAVVVQNGVNWAGLVIALVFSLSVYLGSTSVLTTLKTKFEQYQIAPIAFTVFSAILLFLTRFTLASTILAAFVGTSVLIWTLLAMRSKRNTSSELVLGGITLSLLSSLIMYFGSNETSEAAAIRALSIAWILSGIAAILVLHVEALRGRVSRLAPLQLWIVYLFTFAPIYMLSLVPLQTVIAFVEPTGHGLYQLYRSLRKLPSKRPSFKVIGLRLTFRITLFVLVFTGLLYI